MDRQLNDFAKRNRIYVNRNTKFSLFRSDFGRGEDIPFQNANEAKAQGHETKPITVALAYVIHPGRLFPSLKETEQYKGKI